MITPTCHRLRLFCLFILSALPVCQAELIKKRKAADTADLPTLMTTRGKLLLDEPFKDAEWAKTLKPYKGDFQLIDGQLKVAPQAGANHPPQASFYAPMTNVVAQIRFRLDGAQRVSVMLGSPERSENIASVTVDSHQVTISRMTGWGGTTKVISLAKKELKVDKDRWYTLLVEWCGNECSVQVDDKFVLYASDPELVRTKGQFSLQSGGSFAWYDDVRVWQAEIDPTWEKRKGRVIASAGRSR